MSVIERKNSNANVSRSIYDQVSANELLTFHSDTKFLVLGFIVALIEHANANFENSGQEWMEFYAKSSKNFKIHGMSINEVRKFNLQNYVLFFDEFEGHGWTVLVRNLSRAAYLTLFVANTNTNAANLVGKVQSRFSRIEPDFVWSLVVNRLNSMNLRILRGISPGIVEKINEIAQNSDSDNERGRLLHGFFDDFIVNQLKHLRAGFADLICSNLHLLNITSASGISLNYVLETMVNPLLKEMRKKKPRMYTELDGILGSFALYIHE